MILVDRITEKLYHIKRPNHKKGFLIERYYCECGCKKWYWIYVKIDKL